MVKWRKNDDGSCVKLFHPLEVERAVIAQNAWNHEGLEDRMLSKTEKDNASDVLINDVLDLLGRMHPTSVAFRAEEPSLQAIRDTLARSRLETTKDIRYPENSMRQLYGEF